LKFLVFKIESDDVSLIEAWNQLLFHLFILSLQSPSFNVVVEQLTLLNRRFHEWKWNDSVHQSRFPANWGGKGVFLRTHKIIRTYIHT